MAGGIGIGSILKLIGGKPHMKAGSVIAEKLPITKMLDGGGLGSIISQVLQNGPGAILKNPVGQLTSQLQSQLGGLVGQLQSSAGAGAMGGLISALTGGGGGGGLDGALSALQAVTNNLSGLTNLTTMPGRLDVFTHAQAIEAYGTALPAALNMSAALAPMQQQAKVQEAVTQVPVIVANVLNGTLDPDVAATQIQTYTDTFTNAISASATAFSIVEAQAMLIAGIHATAATALPVTHLAAVQTPSELEDFINQTVQAAAKAAMLAAAADHVNSPDPPPPGP